MEWLANEYKKVGSQIDFLGLGVITSVDF